MADTDRTDAKSRRAEARRRRREGGQEPGGDEQHAAEDETADTEHGGLKHAAKVAATGAAVGAAVAAALASRGDGGEADDGAAQAEPEPQDELEAQDDRSPADESQAQEPTATRAEPAANDSRSQPSVREPEAGKPESDEPVRGASPGETAEVVRIAREQLQALQGREPESVSSLARTAEGWAVTLEVVELPRVPDSTDVLASYELVLDEDKNVIRYARARRYYRSQADSDGGL